MDGCVAVAVAEAEAVAVAVAEAVAVVVAVAGSLVATGDMSPVATNQSKQKVKEKYKNGPIWVQN